MHNKLTQILSHKQGEIAALKQHLASDYHDLDHHRQQRLKNHQAPKSLRAALTQQPGVAIISEIKRRSPSKGALATIDCVNTLVDRYIAGGASAVSVLTERNFFSGSLDDLEQICHHLRHHDTPVLRKDFILDPLQIIESFHHGADAILLIVAVLQQRTAELLNVAKQLGLDAIVEVHDHDELALAVDSGAEIIGVNNRNLKTFNVDIHTALTLAAAIPDTVVKIAESGLHGIDDIKKVAAAGFDAALIGEALVKHDDPTTLIQQMCEVRR